MPAAPRRILVIVTRRIGDVLLATALTASLRRAWPGAVLDLLAYPGTAGILEGNPDLDQVICIPERPRGRDYLGLVPRLLRRYDLALATLTGDRPHALAWLAAPRRVSVVPPAGQPGAWWKRRLSWAWVELDDVLTHTVQQYLRLADCLGIPRHGCLMPPRDAAAGELLRRLLAFDPAASAYAVLHPAPKFHYKRWHGAGWRGLMADLQRRGLRVVISGGPGAEEAAYLTELLAGAPPGVVSLAGRLSLAQTAELLRGARLFVGTDTAVTHLAAACGIATLALFGPSNPVKWAPWPQGYAGSQSPFAMRGPLQLVGNVALVQGGGDCVPCREEGCERRLDSPSRCLDELALERVLAAVGLLLDPRAGHGGASVPPGSPP